DSTNLTWATAADGAPALTGSTKALSDEDIFTLLGQAPTTPVVIEFTMDESTVVMVEPTTFVSFDETVVFMLDPTIIIPPTPEPTPPDPAIVNPLVPGGG